MAVQYNTQEHQDGKIVIQAKEDHLHWLVEAVFDNNEREYAEAFCRILNAETKKATESAEWRMSSAYYKSTGKFFDY